MRAGKIGRLVVRAVIVGALTIGGWVAGTAIASADYSWTISPADGTQAPSEPAVNPPVQSGE
jgi:hypothetical protein